MLFTLCLKILKVPVKMHMVSGDVNGTCSFVHLLMYPVLTELTVCREGLSSLGAGSTEGPGSRKC